jgi:peptidoglycan/LPS O-acetylase OafA/YrhL
MIQRIQSLYLLLIVIVNAIVVFFYDRLDQIANLIKTFAYEYLVFFTIVILLALLALFSFKNRGLQKLLSTIVLLLNSVVLGFLAYTLLIVPGEINFSEKGIWVVVPFISIVCIVLALKGIQRDDNLVKSADRFR